MKGLSSDVVGFDGQQRVNFLNCIQTWIILVCLFVFFYLYPVAWGPKGHGSGGLLYILTPFPDPDQPARS